MMSDVKRTIPEVEGVRLAQAQVSGATLDQFDPPSDVAQAEAIQDAMIAALGWTAAGWKLGASTRAAQAGLGLSRCFSGLIPADRVLASPARLSPDALRFRGVECELAFVLGEGVRRSTGAWTELTATEAVASVHPAIEVPETRFAALVAHGALALVADNGAAGWAVLGPPSTLAALEAFTSATLSINGQPCASGDLSAFVAPPPGASGRPPQPGCGAGIQADAWGSHPTGQRHAAPGGPGRIGGDRGPWSRGPGAAAILGLTSEAHSCQPLQRLV